MTESLIPTGETDNSSLMRKEMFKNAQFVIGSAGNSMIPNNPPDGLFGIRRLQLTDIIPNSVYAIDIGSDLVLKRVDFRGDDQYCCFITCISDNTMMEDAGAHKGRLKYSPYDIQLQNVMGIYKVTDVYKPNEITEIQ